MTNEQPTSNHNTIPPLVPTDGASHPAQATRPPTQGHTAQMAPPLRLRPKEIRARRNRRLLIVAAVVLLATAGYLAYWVSYDRFWVRTDNAYVTGNLVPVAAQASGIITQVLAEETQFVNRGDVIVRLDEHYAYAALGRARGHLGEEVRRVNALFMTRKQLAEKLAARTARLDLAQHDMARYRAAVATGAISKQIVQNTADKIVSLEAELRETQAELDTLDAQVGGTTVMAHPAVDLAKHKLIEAYLEYTRQRIKAPISGYVAKRKAQVGDRVQPGASLLTIVPLDHLWVEANLRETELQHVRPGQAAIVNVSLYGSKQTFHGTVEGLVPGSGSAFALLPPDNSTGNFIHIVERVPVRIALPAEELREHPIRPGLSTSTKIDISGEGQSVWTSFATPTTAEYETDVYADELPAADAIANDVIVANLVVGDADQTGLAGTTFSPQAQAAARDDRRLPQQATQHMNQRDQRDQRTQMDQFDRIERVSPGRDGDSPDRRDSRLPQDLRSRRSPLQAQPFSEPTGVGDRTSGLSQPSPATGMPRRSPEQSGTTAPLSPSLGSGTGLPGSEGGRGTSQFRSGMDRESTFTNRFESRTH